LKEKKSLSVLSGLVSKMKKLENDPIKKPPHEQSDNLILRRTVKEFFSYLQNKEFVSYLQNL